MQRVAALHICLRVRIRNRGQVSELEERRTCDLPNVDQVRRVSQRDWPLHAFTTAHGEMKSEFRLQPPAQLGCRRAHGRVCPPGVLQMDERPKKLINNRRLPSPVLPRGGASVGGSLEGCELWSSTYSNFTVTPVLGFSSDRVKFVKSSRPVVF